MLAEKKVDMITGVLPFSLDPDCARSQGPFSRGARRSVRRR